MKTLTLTLNDELTALNNQAALSRTLANITRRAETLLTEGGYQARSYGENLYVVESPKGDKYTVWHGVEVGYSCDCPCFGRLNTCKHLEAIDLMKQDQAVDAEWERIEECANFFNGRYDR